MRAEGLHPVCKARIEVRLELPGDDEVLPPCDDCQRLAAAALVGERQDRLRALRSADCHIVGPL